MKASAPGVSACRRLRNKSRKTSGHFTRAVLQVARAIIAGAREQLVHDRVRPLVHQGEQRSCVVEARFADRPNRPAGAVLATRSRFVSLRERNSDRWRRRAGQLHEQGTRVREMRAGQLCRLRCDSSFRIDAVGPEGAVWPAFEVVR